MITSCMSEVGSCRSSPWASPKAGLNHDSANTIHRLELAAFGYYYFGHLIYESEVGSCRSFLRASPKAGLNHDSANTIHRLELAAFGYYYFGHLIYEM
jgi:hypothetical protein